VESPTRLAGVGGGGGFGDATAIATAGDVNGDGFADVLLGAYNGNSVLVFEGGPGGISPTPATVFGDLPDGGFGASVAAAGDVDGDGYGDIVFAPSQCSGFDVYVFPGSAAGVTTSHPLRQWAAPSGSQCLGDIAR
jgi:hypothetical protein